MSKIYTQLSDYIADTPHLLKASKETIAIATWYEARLSRQPEIDQLEARIVELGNMLKELIRLDDCDSQCTDWKCSKSCQARTELIIRARKILQ